MSADAKLWTDGDGREWQGSHDGPCRMIGHRRGELSDLLWEIEECFYGVSMRWEIRTYPDGTTGLAGWVA